VKMLMEGWFFVGKFGGKVMDEVDEEGKGFQGGWEEGEPRVLRPT
jgi:hypothetical protein